MQYFKPTTLGALADSRVVVLAGTVTVSQWFSPNLFDIRGWLETGLENRGFSVNAVRMSAAGWVGYTNNVEIELNVFNNFTAEEARQNAQQAIDDITANYGLADVFSNVTLHVQSDAYGGSNYNPPSSYDQTNNNGDDFWGGFLKGSGAAFLVGGVVLAIVLLKK